MHHVGNRNLVGECVQTAFEKLWQVDDDNIGNSLQHDRIGTRHTSRLLHMP
jgi:hypothetical protein